MVILEAMCFAKPVVASDVGGIGEIVRNEVNGYVLENDAHLFSEKIHRILENEELYLKFSQNSFDIFQNELTIDRMVRGYLDIYNR